MKEKIKKICQIITLIGILFPLFSFAQNINNEFTGKLVKPGILRDCPFTDCNIIRYYAETTEIKIIGVDDSDQWYQVKPHDDYGKELNGWMHYSLFTQDFRERFDNSQEEQLLQSEKKLTSNKEEEIKNKNIGLLYFFGNENFQIGLISIFAFIGFLLTLILIRKKFKIISQAKEKLTNFKREKIVVSYSKIVISILIVSCGLGYAINANGKINSTLKEVQQLVTSKKYDEANNILDELENNWLIKNLNFKKGQINEIKLTIERDKYKALEGKLTIAEVEVNKGREAVEEAEEKAMEETIKRTQAEAKAKQEEFEKQLKDQQLSEKEAEEKRMNADNDGDGLTYRMESERGTSDWSVDSDGDGINDKEDSHPAGGGRYLPQSYTWNFEGTAWSGTYSIHDDWFQYYKNKPRSPTGTIYVTYQDNAIKAIAKELEESAGSNNYHVTSFVLSFIQGLSYVSDYNTGYDELHKYPVETLVESNGDCEDTAYLAAAIIRAMDIDVLLVLLPGHMAIGIWTDSNQSGAYYELNGRRYYYFETTAEGWELGDIPSEFRYTPATLIKIPSGERVSNVSPNYKKLCNLSSTFSGYYSDGKEYYSDSRCNNIVYCLPYKGSYYNPKARSFYHDNSCSVISVAGCYKSTYNPGYFFDTYNNYYSDSRCLNRAYTTTTTWYYTTTTTTVPQTTTTTTTKFPTTTTTSPTTTTTTTTIPPTTTTTTTTTEPPTTTTTEPPTTTTTEPPATTTTVEP